MSAQHPGQGSERTAGVPVSDSSRRPEDSPSGTTGRGPGFGPGGGGRGMMMGGRIEQARDPRGVLRRSLSYLRPQMAALVGIILLVIVSTVLGLIGPYLLGVAIDRYITTKDAAGLARLGLLLLATYVGSWLAAYLQARSMTVVSQKVLRAMRRDLFEHMQTLSLGFFDRRTAGELMSRLTNDIDAINRVLSQSIVQLVGNLFSLVGIVVIMVSMNGWLALGTLSILPFMLWFTSGVARGTRRGFRDVQAGLGRLNALMEEDITGARVVQAYGQQVAAINQFDEANIAVRNASIRAQSLALLLPPVLSVLSNLDIAVVVGLGGWMALHGMVSVGVIASFVIYARRFFGPLRDLADLYNSIQSALAGAERVFDLLDQKPELLDAPDAVELAIVGRVEFDHVDFAYVPGVPVLADVSLVAEPGQTIALVGPTGAGKTTIVNLLTRFYDVSAGAIRIDGYDLRSVKQDSLRRQLGIVLQDTFLFSDTVLENIRYGRLEASDQECVAAARLANADQFICRLPEGYQTQLSERASNLSQGQRQLLAIARAVLADPRILVLDEATSSVDTRTEVTIQQALLKLMEGRTAFVIAHRLSTIRKADLVLVVNDGRIIERGTHEQLLAMGGFYHHLYMSQFARVAEPVMGAGE